MPPSVVSISPTRRISSRRSEQLNSSLQSLMRSYRDELTKPWDVNPSTESKPERRKNKKCQNDLLAIETSEETSSKGDKVTSVGHNQTQATPISTSIRDTVKRIIRRGSLYEDFPATRISSHNLDVINNSIHDEHGIFVKEVNWKDTAVDWGDEKNGEERTRIGRHRSSIKNNREVKSMV
jgi:hypothetical protein